MGVAWYSAFGVEWTCQGCGVLVSEGKVRETRLARSVAEGIALLNGQDRRATASGVRTCQIRRGQACQRVACRSVGCESRSPDSNATD